MPVREIPLSDFGLETVAEVCARRGCAVKTVQQWITAGLLPAVVVGTGRSAKFLVRIKDADAVPLMARGQRRSAQVAESRTRVREVKPRAKPKVKAGK